MKHNTYALITGGSSGLGKELLLQCASSGFNIVVIALPGGNLKSLAQQIRTEFAIDVAVFELDITNQVLLLEKLKYIGERYPINLLINNAGIGGTSLLSESSFEYLDTIIQLNIRANVTVTKTMLSYLMRHKRSYIMNIASMAAFSPMAYKTVYPASKAFISSFYLGLREELKHKGVSVSVVYPAGIMTNSNVSQRILALGLKGKIGLLPTAEIARIALKETLANKAMIIPGIWNRINYALMSLLPLETRSKVVSNTIKGELKLAAI